MNKDKIKKISRYIFLNSKPQKADLAIVFGNRHIETLDAVFKLFKKKLISKILLSGGINKTTNLNEAHEMKKTLKKMGVGKKNIIIEDKSTNSLENVLFSKNIIQSKVGFEKIKKIIAVVKHYHSRRALMTLKKHFPKGIKVFPVTYEVYGFNSKNWYKSEVGREKVLKEWCNIRKYLDKGDIEEL